MKIAAAIAAVLLSLTLTPAHADNGQRAPQVFVIGDSIAWAYAGHIKSTQPVVNKSIPGSCLFVRKCASEAAPRYMDRLRAADIRPGDTVVISVGHNDLLLGRGRDYMRAYRNAVRYVESQDAVAVVATITPFGGKLEWGRDEMNERRIKVNRWIVKQMPAIDLGSALGGDHMRARFNSGDGLHPNSAGAVRLGAAVTVALKRLRD